jgi:hypothetical protein
MYRCAEQPADQADYLTVTATPKKLSIYAAA